jgi:hypothetical protein
MQMPADHGRRPAIAALLVLVALWAIFLRNTFDPGRSFALDMDNEFFIGTVLSAISSALSHGTWPLRMDTVLGGLPLYNFPQLSPLYPFYLAPLPIFRTPGEVVHSMHWITLAHLLILEINTFVFLRVIGASRIGAIAGAALFAFSANSLTYSAWLNITAPYAWFPLYLAGLVGIFKHPGTLTYPAIALVAIVLLTLASPAQPLIHAVMVSAVFVIAYWVSHGLAEGWRLTKRPLAVLTAVGVLAVLIVAPVLIPTAVEFKDMIRWIGSFPPVVGNARIPFEAFQIDQLSVARLAGIFFKQEGAAVGSPYVGVIGIALAGVAATSCLRSWIARALLFIAIYSIASSTGSNLGLAHLNYLIPLLNKIREPSRFLVLFQFAVAALAALGIDQIRRVVEPNDQPAREHTRRKFATLWVFAALSLAVMLAMPGRVVSAMPSWASVLVLAALTVLTIAQSRWPSINRGRIIGSLWAAAALLFLAADVQWMPAPISVSRYNTSGGRALDQVFDRLVELDPKRQYRIVFDGEIDKQMASMLASYKNIRTLNAYFNPAPYRQFEELYYHSQRSPNYFQALGARYLVCDVCTPEAIRGYRFLEHVGSLSIHEAKDALPHSLLMTTIGGTYTDMNDFAAKLATVDLAKGLLYVHPDNVDLLGAGAHAACMSSEERRSAIRLRVSTFCADRSVLVVNEFYDASWKASVDGKRVELLRVNGSQMAIAVPSGEHVVELRYRPGTFLLSLPIALAGLILAVFAFVMVWLKRRKVQTDSHPYRR